MDSRPLYNSIHSRFMCQNSADAKVLEVVDTLG